MPGDHLRGRQGTLGLILPPSPALDGVPFEILTRGSTDPATTGTTSGVGSWIAGATTRAERAGADAIWVVDHIFWGQPMLECLTTLALVAAHSTRATIGSGVLQLPLRRAPIVAKQASALSMLADGRFVLGVGVGSHAAEYALCGAPFDTRGRDLDRAIDEVRASWRHDETPYRQLPATAETPIWVGGSSRAAARRAARRGDGWFPLFLSPAELAVARDELCAEATDSGRDPATITQAMVVVVAIGEEAAAAERGARWLGDLYDLPPKAFSRHLLAGSASSCAERLHEYVEAGAEHVAVMVAGTGALDQFEALADAYVSHAPVLSSGAGTKGAL